MIATYSFGLVCRELVARVLQTAPAIQNCCRILRERPKSHLFFSADFPDTELLSAP
jgi:hypothetical protein